MKSTLSTVGFGTLGLTLLGTFGFGCQSSGVGDPCTPEDEYQTIFSGYSKDEVNVESRSFQCETRVCLVNHFQGRVSCPYGQSAEEIKNGATFCSVPGTSGDNPADKIGFDSETQQLVAGGVAVDPQLVERRADKAVYCSCRCDGPDANAKYCECPSGYACEKLVDDLGLGSGQLAGSYCVKDGTQYGKGATGVTCARSTGNCD